MLTPCHDRYTQRHDIQQSLEWSANVKLSMIVPHIDIVTVVKALLLFNVIISVT